MQHLAYYDSLTDLPNRTLFGDRLQQTLTTAAHNHQLAALVLVSLDRFKKINDTLGHATGDLLLQQVASRLAQRTKKGDTIARFGGDEFAFLLTSIERTDEAAEFARELLEALLLSFDWRRRSFISTPVSASVCFLTDGADAETIMKNAGAALFRAKRKGGGGYEFYSSDMNAESVKRLALETDLRRAVANQEFVTYYQPVIDFSSGKVIGIEALVRWQHPAAWESWRRRSSSISRKTPGMILGYWGSGIRTLPRRKLGAGRTTASATCGSRLTFPPGNSRRRTSLIAWSQILAAARLDPQSVELEITETSIMEHGNRR